MDCFSPNFINVQFTNNIYQILYFTIYFDNLIALPNYNNISIRESTKVHKVHNINVYN